MVDLRCCETSLEGFFETLGAKNAMPVVATRAQLWSSLGRRKCVVYVVTSRHVAGRVGRSSQTCAIMCVVSQSLHVHVPMDPSKLERYRED